MVVQRVVRNGCALVVRTPGAKLCARRTAQGFCVVQKGTFRTRQGFEPCAKLISLELFPSHTVVFSCLLYFSEFCFFLAPNEVFNKEVSHELLYATMNLSITF